MFKNTDFYERVPHIRSVFAAVDLAPVKDIAYNVGEVALRLFAWLLTLAAVCCVMIIVLKKFGVFEEMEEEFGDPKVLLNELKAYITAEIREQIRIHLGR